MSTQNLYMNFYIFVIATYICKQHKYPFADEWINKMWYTHTMKSYLATKK